MGGFKEAADDVLSYYHSRGRRNRYYYAWATLTGKVFVDPDDLMEKLAEMFPDKCYWNHDEAEWIDDTSEEEKQQAFHELATTRLHDLFLTDDPMKLYDMQVDRYEQF
jgi:hypothetical protein